MYADLISKALTVRENAYAPYSGFKVGAALLAEDGRIFTGANVENAAYPAGCCAERAAVFSAISAGAKRFTAIAIVGGRDGNMLEYCPPCGICRQVMGEFANEDFAVILAQSPDAYKIYTLRELLPFSFSEKNL